MIESKEQVLGDFRRKAQIFLASPSPVSGIDLDDATVTLKRYVLSEMRDAQLGSLLGTVPKLIRKMEMDALSKVLDQVNEQVGE